MALTQPIEGVGFRLRCVEEADAEAIVALRNDPKLSRYLPPLKVTVEQQRSWIAGQRLSENQVYYVVEDIATGRFEGLTSLYDIKTVDGRKIAEWGRFVIRSDSLAAPETSYLTHLCAFEVLGLDDVYGYSVLDNVAVISFHRSCGLEDRGEAAVSYEIDGVTHHTRCFGLASADWPAFKAKLEPAIRRAATFASRSRKA